MKILFDCSTAFSLAHGGVQIQIEQTKTALERLGIEVEFWRWWDDRQRGDLIHFFGTAQNAYLQKAREAGIPVVLTSLFSETCNRSDWRLRCQKWMTHLALAAPFGNGIKQQLTWQTYKNCAHNIVGLNAERKILENIYQVQADKISVVPLGLSENFRQAGQESHNGPSLICVGTIRPVKHSIELAEMARAAQVPILFVGKPYSAQDAYWQRFQSLIDKHWVKHHPHVDSELEMIRLLQSARGLVLMSDYENWSLASHEAIACGLPLLVQDQKWSRERFGTQAWYFDEIGFNARNIEILKKFWTEAPHLSPPRIKLFSWAEVAERLRTIYEQILSASR